MLLPTVAILHATENSNTAATTSHDSDQHDQNHQDQEHDDNETSDDNSTTHVELDDANDNANRYRLALIVHALRDRDVPTFFYSRHFAEILPYPKSRATDSALRCLRAFGSLEL